MIQAILPILAPIISKTLNRILPEDPQTRMEAEREIQMAILSQMQEIERQAADIILAEAKGESWLQRNWRPLLMLVCIFIIGNNFILTPYLAAFGLPTTMLALPDSLWNLMTLGVGGYIAGRSVEKGIRFWKGNGSKS